MPQDSTSPTADAADDSPHLPEPLPRKWAFRLIASGVPLLLGGVLIVWILVAQERLVTDPETGWPKLQRPPIYLEEPGHERTGHRYVYDPLLGWRNIPGWSATSLGRKLTINSKGLRDREYAYEPPDNTRRILVLGDSYAWGYGVEDDEIFTEVLESRLQETSPPWEVVNTGVSGWGTDQELLYLENEGFRYQPDLVVVAFFLINDPVNNVHSSQYGLHKPVFLDLELTLGNTAVPLPASRSEPFLVNVDPIELTCAVLQRMERACVDHDCRLVIMKFGRFLHPDHPGVLSLEEKFERTLAKHEHPLYLDLDEAFEREGYSPRSLLEGNDDGHWNAHGHEATAEILESYLLDGGLLGIE
jgi:lysophospholipase L1-like esterase